MSGIDDRTLAAVLARQRLAFRRDGAPPLDARLDALGRLRAAIAGGDDEIVRAVDADFGGRSAHETRFLEIAASLAAIDESVAHLGEWMRPQSVPSAPLLGAAAAFVTPRPLGVVGIIVPWNYPVGLAVTPLVGALSAGNRVMLKASANTPRTADVLKRLLSSAFNDEEVAVVAGGPGLGAAFAALPLDHIFFTGSTDVGRAVMRAAAENLVPVTLELAGKCPVIVAPDYPIESAIQPIAWGKTVSAGQTCVAPDYALVPGGAVARFVDEMRGAFSRMFPAIASNPDYTSIINEREYARIMALLSDAAGKGATLVQTSPAGEGPAGTARRIPPTLVLGATREMAIMREEIFGPILPVVPYDSIDEAIALVNQSPPPLALYLFTDDEPTKEAVVARAPAGGVTINGTLSHMIHEGLPFGGVGPSGIGSYHGRWGFQQFSHAQASLDHGAGRRPIDRLAAPYGPFFDRLVATWLGR
jgi:coniferyl-aldehyde dehydrogenase